MGGFNLLVYRVQELKMRGKKTQAKAAGTKIVNIGRWHPEPPHEVPRAYRLVEASRPWENADIYRSARILG